MAAALISISAGENPVEVLVSYGRKIAEAARAERLGKPYAKTAHSKLQRLEYFFTQGQAFICMRSNENRLGN